MSERNEQARLDQLIDQAVEEFLAVPDAKVLGRVKELTGKETSLTHDFDRLMAPILRQHGAEESRNPQMQGEIVISKWQRFLPWNSVDHLTSSFFSRPARSAFAVLALLVAGATVSVPLWRLTPMSDPGGTDHDESHIPRSVPKDVGRQQSAHPSTVADAVFMAQLTKSYSFSKAAEALDRIKYKYPSVLRDQSLVVRKANSGEDPGAYIGGIGDLKSARDAEQICSTLRAGGDQCNVINVGNE